MIRALLGFLGREGLPRKRDILRSSEVVIAGLGAIAVAVWGSSTPLARLHTSDIVIAVLTYAAVAFGFSVAGLTVALTALGDRFGRELAWSVPGQAGIAKVPVKQNSYSNLLFIFSWTAIAHWVVVIGSLGVLVSIGGDVGVLAAGSSDMHRIGVGAWSGATIYAVEMFLVTVITLADVGDSLIKRLHRTPPPTR